MLNFVINRIASAGILLIGLLTIVFIISHLAPGDPVTALISPSIPSAVADKLRRQFGLDQPLLAQYGHWLKNTLSGELGISFRHQRSVMEVIANFLPKTMMLGFTAICLELVVGLLLGLLAVRYYGSILDKMVSNLGLIVYTLPTFWIGLVLLAFFSYALGLLPSSQMHSINAENLSFTGRAFDLFKHLILPALTIALPGAAGIARYFRTSLLKVQREEYVMFAQSLGLSKSKIFFSYELRNALAPVITIVGLEIGTLLAGAIVAEIMFAWPGMGRLAVMAIFARDYPLVMGCTLVSGVVVVLGNFVPDVFYMLLDPRVRPQK